MISTEDIIAKAKKLIALRDRGSTPQEAEAAARVLAKFIDKHRISVAQLETESGDVEACVVDESEPLFAFRNLQLYRRVLCEVLCEHYGVAWWQRTVRVGRNQRGNIYNRGLYMCGRPSDIVLVRYMFAWLGTEAERLGRKQADGRVARKSFCLGFVSGLRAQLAAARVTVEQKHGLVLRNRLSQAAEALQSALDLTDLRTRNPRVDREAFENGKRTGKAIHLGERIPASGATPALTAGGA